MKKFDNCENVEVRTVGLREYNAEMRGYFPDGLSRGSRRNKIKQGEVIGAFDGDRMIGIATMKAVRDMAILEKIEVEREYWRRGIGRRMVDSVLFAARERGLEKLMLKSVDEDSDLFYEALGMTRIGRSRLREEDCDYGAPDMSRIFGLSQMGSKYDYEMVL